MGAASTCVRLFSPSRSSPPQWTPPRLLRPIWGNANTHHLSNGLGLRNALPELGCQRVAHGACVKDYTGTRPSRSGISAPIEATHPITNSYREQIHGPSRFGCNSEDILAELQYRITCHERMPRSLRLWKLSSAPRAVHREPSKSVTTAWGFELNRKFFWISGQCFSGSLCTPWVWES